jgi:hypothetical protein
LYVLLCSFAYLWKFTLVSLTSYFYL